MPAPKDPEKRKLMIERMRAARELYHKNHPNATKEAANTPQARANMRAAAKKRYEDPEEHRKQSDALLGKSHSDIHKEKMCLARYGISHVGPKWYKYPSEFIKLAATVYGLKCSVTRRRIERILKSKKLTILDLALFINYYSVGHSLHELAEHFEMDRNKVEVRLKCFTKAFPYVSQEQVSGVWPSRAIYFEMPDGDIIEIDIKLIKQF